MSNLKLLVSIFKVLEKIEQETTYCPFFNYFGHTESFDLHIASSKEYYTNSIFERGFYLDRDDTESNIEVLEEELLQVLKDGKGKKFLLKKLKKENIKKEYQRRIDLGVPEKRAISDIAKKEEMTQSELRSILNQ